MARPSRVRGRQDRRLCSSRRQVVEDNRPLCRVQTLSRRRGTRQPLGHGSNVGLQLISNRRGTRRSRSPSPNRSCQRRRQSYSEWRTASNGELEIFPRREVRSREMATFEDNVLRGAFQNLHRRIVHHLLMLWMAAAPDGIVHQLMSMIKSHV
jgi:hypothetical protein